MYEKRRVSSVGGSASLGVCATLVLVLQNTGSAATAMAANPSSMTSADSPPSDAAARGRSLRQQGIGLYREDRFEEAMELYKQALELGPELPENHAYVATACFKLKDVECAEKEYMTAIDLLAARGDEPTKSIPYRSNLGGVYHRTKRFEKAVETFNDALAIAPGDASLKMNLDATIVDWHKHIMELEIESAADPSNRTSPFWDIPNLLCGRNYTEKAEVVFKEIVEQRALELLPPALTLIRQARLDEPDFAISAHLLADIAVRWHDESANMSAALQQRLTEDGDALLAEAKAELAKTIELESAEEIAAAAEEALSSKERTALKKKQKQAAKAAKVAAAKEQKSAAEVSAGGSTGLAEMAEVGEVDEVDRASSLSLAKLHVVCVATEIKPELKLLYGSALDLGVKMSVLGLGAPWRGLASKIALLKEYLADVPSTDLVLFVDAYDVLLLADAKHMIQRFLALKAPVVFSAEYTCAPDKGLSLLYAHNTTMQFSYVNSGSYIGYVSNVQVMLDEVQRDIAVHHTMNGADQYRLDDQRWFNRYYVRHQSDGSIALDRTGILFHTLHDVPLSAFGTINGEENVGALHSGVVADKAFAVASEQTGADAAAAGRPCLIHGNGNGLTVFKTLAGHLKNMGWPTEAALRAGERELAKMGTF